jgi:hypothetical protein
MLGISTRMTRAGGATKTHWRRGPGERVVASYEISIAVRPLLMTFAGIQRPVYVCGLPCQDRLAALQRIMEHEVIHLVELLTCGRSSCAGRRFKALAANIFGHTKRHHELVTAQEQAAVEHGVKPGSLVEFEFDGRRLSGRVNRINRRATILVEDPRGRRYTDGKTYAKFYVPLERLRAV